jgi:carbon-monoxide dehydrogenase small subunit
MVLIGQADGREITTVKGVGTMNLLHPLQENFIKYGAVQCGFCTPGMILSAKALLDRNPSPTREEIIAGISGNLCRCTGYEKIVDAIEATAMNGKKNQKRIK